MINVVKTRNWYFAFSGIVMAICILSLIAFGLKPGIDFTNGTLIELSFTERPEKVQVEQLISEQGYDHAVVQPVGTDGYLLRLPFMNEAEHQEILTDVRNTFEKDQNKVLEKSVETVGPSVSAQLKSRAWKAGLAILICVVAYVTFAFRRVSKPVQSWKYGLITILALLHDVLGVMGIFALLGHFYGVEVDIAFVVALLTILGYSVNDTIVVFDRIREELMRQTGEPFEDIVARGLKTTMVRSLNTSFTVLLVLFALFFYGGASIHYFSLALIVGMIFGTYSSIFVASPLLVVWYNWSKKY